MSRKLYAQFSIAMDLDILVWLIALLDISSFINLANCFFLITDGIIEFKKKDNWSDKLNVYIDL